MITDKLVTRSLLLSLVFLIAMTSGGMAVAPEPAQQAALAAVPYSATLEESLAKAPAGYISDVKTRKENENLVVTVATSGRLAYQDFLLDNPPRLVVDFLNVENRVPVMNMPIETDGVKQLRVRQFHDADPKIARMVIDMADARGGHEIQADDSSLRIVIRGGAPTRAASEAKTPASMPTAAPDRADPAADNRRSTEPSNGSSSAAEPSNPGTPVISDLALEEIPQSALTTAQPVVQAPPSRPPAARKVDPPPPPSPPAPPPMRLNPVPDSRYSGQPLTLDLVNISLVDFFRLMSEEGGVNIVMDPGIKGNLSIKVVQVPWDQVFEAAMANNALDMRVEGNLIRIASKATLQTEAKQEEALKKANLLAADVETRIKRLNYAKAKDFEDALKDQMTVRGTVVVDERNNALVLTDIPVSLEKAVQLVESLDTPQPQVEIEARIVSATRDFARDIGVQFGFVQGNLERVSIGGPNTFGTIGGTRPAATPKNTYAAGNPSTGRGASEGSSTESAGTSTGNVENDKGNFNVNLPAQRAFGGIGISIGNIFDTFLLDAAITAGEAKGLAKLISQPKVTAQNNSEATITQGLRFPVQVIANNTVTVQFQNAALTLRVVPQITFDGTIVLDIRVENNTPDFARSVQGIPSIRTSESETRVLVSDGGTTVIGGILIENEQNQEERVPGLASIPLIGNLFRRSLTTRSTQEVLFFITPRIVK
ncbi:MAG: type IV pilus secretin PilQ [Acidobacteriota bacterium]